MENAGRRIIYSRIGGYMPFVYIYIDCPYIIVEWYTVDRGSEQPVKVNVKVTPAVTTLAAHGLRTWPELVDF